MGVRTPGWRPVRMWMGFRDDSCSALAGAVGAMMRCLSGRKASGQGAHGPKLRWMARLDRMGGLIGIQERSGKPPKQREAV